MEKILQNKWIVLMGLVGLFGIFILLFYRAPYSNRTLVGNLEPYPDTLFYSQPAWNMVHGKGYVMRAYGYATKIVTPPVYTMYLAPFFAVFDDVRSFYIANIFLALGSLAMLLIIIRMIFKGKYSFLFMLIAGFLYVTNYYIFTLPTLLMAENISMVLLLIMVYLIVQKITIRNVYFAGIIGILMLGVKFSNAALTAVFYLLYLWKIYKKESLKSRAMKHYLISAGASCVAFAIYIITSQILVDHKNLTSNTSMDIKYIIPHMRTYFHTLMGAPASFLWFYYPMLSRFIGMMSLIGIFLSLKSAQMRKNALYLLAITGALLLFSASFYATDSRYIIVLYPIIIIFVCYVFQYVFDKTRFIQASMISIVLIGVYLVVPAFGQVPPDPMVITLKKQVGINFRHAQVPWHAIAVREWHEFAKRQNTKIYIGTFLPPYFMYYYAGEDINYVPATAGQEFFYDKIDQSNNYTVSLADYYTSLLEDGNKVYVSSYYSTNISGWDKEYNSLVSNFRMDLAHEACMGVCNLYELRIKN